MADEKKEETTLPNSENKDEGKIKFDEKQTAFVNELVSEAYARAAKKVETEAQKKIKELEDAVAAATAKTKELETKITPPKEEKKEPQTLPELDSLKAQFAEMKGVFDSVKSERDELRSKVEKAENERVRSRKKDLWLEAAQKAKVNFFDPLEAYRLAEDDGYEYDKDSDKPIIKNKSTGVAKLNENGEPMSVFDFVRDFAKRKNYLVQATDAGGTGSGEQRVTKPKEEEKKVDFNSMSPAEFEAYRQKVIQQQR